MRMETKILPTVRFSNNEGKFVSRICEKFPIPVECVPAAYKSATTKLYELGADKVHLRLSGKCHNFDIIINKQT